MSSTGDRNCVNDWRLVLGSSCADSDRQRRAVRVTEHQDGETDANSFPIVRLLDDSSGDDKSMFDSEFERRVDVDEVELPAKAVEDDLPDEIHFFA